MSAITIDRFLTPEEVSAEIFGGAVSPDRIVRLSKHHGLPSHRVGRRRMYLADEVAAWTRSRDGDGDVDPATTTLPVSPDASTPVDPAWVAAQVAKFSADDLRRAGQLLLALSQANARGNC
ncbi:MAG: helix-turn-helix domain-containing protein [Actinobacteria bacterium]|nr:helix-turn-helix domain-containing protein [Actinomycetota bacterium]